MKHLIAEYSTKRRKGARSHTTQKVYHAKLQNQEAYSVSVFRFLKKEFAAMY